MKKGLLVLLLAACSFGTTWFVRTTGSDDSTGKSYAQALLTLQAGYDSLVAGDTLRICGNLTGQTYTVSATIDVDMNNSTKAQGTTTSKIKVYASDTVDGSIYNGTGRVLITTSSTLASGLLAFDSVATYMDHQDFVYNGGGTGKAEYCISTTRANDKAVGNRFLNCGFTNADNHGIYYRSINSGTAGKLYLERCEINNNGKGGTGWGMYSPFTSRATWDLIGCSVHDNPSGGAEVYSYSLVENCLFYDNDGDGLKNTTTANTGWLTVVNNTFVANSGDGCDIAALGGSTLIVTGNIARSNGAYGYNFNGSAIDRFLRIDYNCASNNTTNPTDINSNVLPGTHNVTGDPLFVSETDGAENFNLQTGSPCKNVGLNPYGY